MRDRWVTSDESHSDDDESDDDDEARHHLREEGKSRNLTDGVHVWRRPKPAYIAMKVMNASEPGIRDMWLNEVMILRKLAPIASQRNLLEYVDAYIYDNKCYILTAFYPGGDLFSAVENMGASTYSERSVALMMRHMFRALQACHESGITHRDIKPENFVFTTTHAESPLRLIDFGCSKQGSPDQLLPDKPQSVYYVAPEVLAPDASQDSRYSWRRCRKCSELYCPSLLAAVIQDPASPQTNTDSGSAASSSSSPSSSEADDLSRPSFSVAGSSSTSSNSGSGGLSSVLRGVLDSGRSRQSSVSVSSNISSSSSSSSGSANAPLLHTTNTSTSTSASSLPSSSSSLPSGLSLPPKDGAGLCRFGGFHIPDPHGVYRLRKPAPDRLAEFMHSFPNISSTSPSSPDADAVADAGAGAGADAANGLASPVLTPSAIPLTPSTATFAPCIACGSLVCVERNRPGQGYCRATRKLHVLPTPAQLPSLPSPESTSAAVTALTNGALSPVVSPRARDRSVSSVSRARGSTSPPPVNLNDAHTLSLTRTASPLPPLAPAATFALLIRPLRSGERKPMREGGWKLCACCAVVYRSPLVAVRSERTAPLNKDKEDAQAAASLAIPDSDATSETKDADESASSATSVQSDDAQSVATAPATAAASASESAAADAATTATVPEVPEASATAASSITATADDAGVASGNLPSAPTDATATTVTSSSTPSSAAVSRVPSTATTSTSTSTASTTPRTPSRKSSSASSAASPYLLPVDLRAEFDPTFQAEDEPRTCPYALSRPVPRRNVCSFPLLFDEDARREREVDDHERTWGRHVPLDLDDDFDFGGACMDAGDFDAGAYSDASGYNTPFSSASVSSLGSASGHSTPMRSRSGSRGSGSGSVGGSSGLSTPAVSARNLSGGWSRRPTEFFIESSRVMTTTVWRGADMWSMGVVMYVLLTGRAPFYSPDWHRIPALILSGVWAMPDNISPSAKDLLARLLTRDPLRRPTAWQVLHHPWLHSGAPNVSSRPLRDVGRALVELRRDGQTGHLRRLFARAVITNGLHDEKRFECINSVLDQADHDGDGQLSVDDVALILARLEAESRQKAAIRLQQQQALLQLQEQQQQQQQGVLSSDSNLDDNQPFKVSLLPFPPSTSLLSSSSSSPFSDASSTDTKAVTVIVDGEAGAPADASGFSSHASSPLSGKADVSGADKVDVAGTVIATVPLPNLLPSADALLDASGKNLLSHSDVLSAGAAGSSILLDSSMTVDASGLDLELTPRHVEEANQIMQLLQVSNDNKLNQTELKVALAAATIGSSQSVLGSISRVFNMLDRNRDGFIDADELYMACSSFLSRDEAADVIIVVDENGDGRIDLAEFTRAVSKQSRRNSFQRSHASMVGSGGGVGSSTSSGGSHRGGSGGSGSASGSSSSSSSRMLSVPVGPNGQVLGRESSASSLTGLSSSPSISYQAPPSGSPSPMGSTPSSLSSSPLLRPEASPSVATPVMPIFGN